MVDVAIRSQCRARAAAAGLTARDLAFLEAIDWDDARVPSATEDTIALYRALEDGLNKAVAHLDIDVRIRLPENRLAAAIGARIADWRERHESADEAERR